MASFCGFEVANSKSFLKGNLETFKVTPFSKKQNNVGSDNELTLNKINDEITMSTICALKLIRHIKIG